MLNIHQILESLPHRYPMLLVDRLVEINETRTKCRGIKNVTINEPFFQGHYPGEPIMPGVLIVETMAQVGAALLLSREEMKGRIPVIGAIDNAKFRRPVRPGDQLVIDAEVRARSTAGRMKAVATVDGVLVAEAEITFSLMDRSQRLG